MFAQERHQVIKTIIRKHRRMNFAELQRVVKVSPATLRRDLTEMEEAGDIIRVHGGILDPGYVRSEVSLNERVLKNSNEKKSIATAAARLVPAGAVVLIDAGSTCLELGRALLGRKDVRIITHSLALLEAAFHGEAPTLCIGGELRRVSGALTGGAALGTLARIHANIAFVGASGLHAREGCTTTETSEAAMKQAILARASRRILLADHSKWDQASTIRFAEWKDLTDWVTDVIPTAPETQHLRSLGVKLHRA
jgi:DeoR family fructose operon transcriptional repressor